ncbi:uncharacterized protein [Triticum aestivum]|uniref:uncharacterized protein isoform X2 n=1 Tax=Triticum aestivum TaxID=4565 RepID=UPI001D006F93|nr:uncharacterized protein LOC123182584 isoform X2 [Triticum aestivum]
MAAAALGLAARRLGGGALRQTQTRVVELGQRRLLPRSIHTEQQHNCTKKDGVMKRIEKAKEELFDLSAEAHKTYGQDPDPACRKNFELLRDLFNHVKRRPDDPVWNVAMGARLRHDLVHLAGTYALVLGASIGASYMFSEAILWAALPSPRDGD